MRLIAATGQGRRGRQNCRGISLIELMVGITVGMIVVAGASVMMTNQLAEHRRLTLETQVQQDLRAAADLMLRDLRRAGSSAAPQHGIWAPGGAPAPVGNSYTPTILAGVPGSASLEYSYSRHKDRTRSSAAPIPDPEDDVMTPATERFGFSIDTNGTLRFLLGGSWQPLTDNKVLVMTAFDVALDAQTLPLDDLCSTACPAGSATCPPVQMLRLVNITLTGHAVHDAKVERTIKVTSRIRNDSISGACPS
jgi:prepilin peptidase dependent protein B